MLRSEATKHLVQKATARQKQILRITQDDRGEQLGMTGGEACTRTRPPLSF